MFVIKHPSIKRGRWRKNEKQDFFFLNGESNLYLFELSCLANLNPDLSLMCILNYIYHNKFARMIYVKFCDIINVSARYVLFFSIVLQH